MVASAGEKPRFRQDLVAEPIEDGQARFIDVADPDTGALFRFYEVEYSLACAMDGERDVNGIVQWAKEELGLTSSPKEVQIVISTLRDLGYLERGAAAAAAATPGPAAKETPKPAVQPAGVKPPAGKPSVNKWDQPTAMGDPDEYLEPGVIVPKAAPSRGPAADDLELGQAGATSAKVETDLPRAADLELGAPGAAAAPANRPAVPKTADVQLGSSGRSDVSIDLADHMAVGAEDVKEAVRQSQVMKAVDVPKELLESVEPTVASAPAAKKAESKADQRAAAKAERKAEADRKAAAERKAEADRKVDAEKKAEAKEAKAEAKDAKAEAKEAKAEKKAEAKVEKKAEARADAAKAKPAVEAPKREAEKRPVAPPAPKSGTSPVLVAMFVIVVLAAGAFLAYRYLIKKPGTAQTKAPPAPVQPTQAEPPAPPPVETAKLATEQQDAVDLKAVGAGQVETIVANDAAVKAGDVVAQLAGHKGIEADVAAMAKDIDTRVKPELDKAEKDRDAAQTAGNKAAVTAAEARIADRKKSLEDKEAKLSAKKADLAKLQIKAPSDGKVTAVAKASGKVAAGDVVAKLARSPVLTATFKTASGVTPQSHVLLATKTGDQKLSCTVVTADASGVKVACPGDAAAEGTEVSFAGVDPNAPAAQGSGEIEMGDEGSAAAGSATTGPATTGSAAAPATPPAAPEAPAATPTKAPAKAPARRPVHVAPKAPATPADKPADQPADKTPTPPADKPAEAPAPAPSPSTGDTLK